MKRLKILLQSRLFFIISLIFLIGYVLIFIKIINYSSIYNETNNEFMGTLIDYKFDGDKFSFILDGEEKLQASYYFKTLDEKNDYQKKIKLGIKVKVRGSLSKPLNNTIPNTFNYKEYLASKKIYWLLDVQKLEIIDSSTSFLYKVKNSFIRKVNTYTKTNSYMYAFILGDSGYIDSDVYANLQNNGVTHLFAVSGMHIGLFIMVINNLLKKLHFKENFIVYFTICFFFFYLFLVGFSASVVRATMFYMILFLNKRFNGNFKSMRLFYFLFFILLIINPFYIYDIGFIYSFLTSFGLMLLGKKITGNYLVKLFKTSAIAFLFSLPVTLYFYYEFNLMTIINNLIVVPIVSVILFPLSLLTFLLPFLEFFLNIGFMLLENINAFLSEFAINIVIGKVTFFFIFLYYFIIYLFYKYKTSYLYLIVILVLITKYNDYLDSNSYVYYLDVGQGDATFIVTEHRKDIILIDSGGKIEYEKEDWQIRNSSYSMANTLAQFMKSLGISKIDLFIGTHGDMDHIGYAKDLFDIIKLDKIMLNNNNYNLQEKLLLKKNLKQIKNYYKGKNISLYNLNGDIDKDENDSSLVLYTWIDEISLLFMGDAPKEVELNIKNNYEISADILKVGHHGSNTSSDLSFLKTISPRYAIISAGRNNRYNHPSKETINNLNKAKISFFNTQDHGTIKFVLNKGIKNIKFCYP